MKNNRNLQKLNCTIKYQTLFHLKKFANQLGTNNLGVVIDYLVKEKLLSSKFMNSYIIK